MDGRAGAPDAVGDLPDRDRHHGARDVNAFACPLVMIEWVDSIRPESSWVHLADVEHRPPLTCVSVGWLIKDNDDVKALAPNMGGLEDESNVQACGIIRIPTKCILHITRLTESESKIEPNHDSSD